MNFKVVGIGEVLWDLLPSGMQAGGAPLNFAFHARQLGAEVKVITRIGNDANGERMLQRFGELGIGADTVQIDGSLPTGTASVALGQDGTPQFTIDDGAAWDALASTAKALEVIRNADAVYFGTLAQRTATAASVVRQLVNVAPDASLRICDINLRQGFYSREVLEPSLEMANVLKLNDHELAILSPMFDLAGTVNQKMVQLSEHFDLQLVALTRAERGSLLYQSGKWSELPGGKVKIVDTVGAGDAFTAALVVGLMNRLSLEETHRVAARTADYVCSRPGATPALPLELRAAFLETCKAV